MQKKLKILFVPLDAIGHVNAAVGIAQVLIDSGHQVIFAINDQWNGRLVKYGIEEVLISQEDRQRDVDPAKYWTDLLVNGGCIKALTPLETTINLLTKFIPILIQNVKKLDLILEELLISMKPDVIVLDQMVCIPAVEKSGIPWVATCSFNPLMFIDDQNTPPFGSGLAANVPKQEWEAFRTALNRASFDTWKNYNDYIVSRGMAPLKKHRFTNVSNFMNIYGFPMELDYQDMRPLPPKWYPFDNLKRNEALARFEVPEQLKGKPGKLIYFSMGSMGSADVGLMKRLIGILGKSKHRFIVSKGPLHSEYSLADNMWGQQSVPQIQVLPLVSLVITHGGNNTVTETFYFGKPMIVLPLFADQNSNSQRIQEKGFGLQFSPYFCTESELLDGIEKLLNDKELNEKLLKISERIQTENSIGKLPKMIEDLVHKQ